MILDEELLQRDEKINFALRALYRSHGYRMYRMSKFEEYDLYADNKDFLVSDNVITFTDTDGKLMALKPDVTLSIIKNSPDTPDEVQKVFYNENVYRVSDSSGSFREIMQAGAECFGNIGMNELCEVLTLAAESLKLWEDDAVIALSDLDMLSAVIARTELTVEKQNRLYDAIRGKNRHEIDALCADCRDREAAALLKELLGIEGTVGQTLPRLKELFSGIPDTPDGAFARFFAVLERLAGDETFRLDFSVAGDINYYNGMMFRGFLRGIPDAVLSGGQYDRLMSKLGRRSKAIGFAVYTDLLDRVEKTGGKEADGYLNVALPKGRLGEKIYERFALAGFECPAVLEPNRKLIFENTEKKVRYFWVKPSDVAIYVERGAADVGVVGKDILAEYEPDVYELLDLKKGVCRMAVASHKGFSDDGSGTLRVATKFAHVAKTFYRSKGRDIDIIHLNGSIEIAPILGLSDVIVDIVETGATLRENNLEVIEEIFPISARLIANKAAFKFRNDRIESLVKGLYQVTEENV